MNVYIKIEFVIDDVMAWHCIHYLLATYQRPTKKKIIAICRECLNRTGNIFKENPEFEDLTEQSFNRYVDDEVIDKWFEKIWK